VEQAGFSVYGKLMLLSTEALEHNTRVKALHNVVVAEGYSLANVQMQVKNGSAQEVVDKIKNKLQEPFWQMIGVADRVTVINDQGKVSIAF
jgi:hypothetical protein